VRDRSLESLREICPEVPTLGEGLAFFVDEAAETGLHLDLKIRGTEADVVAALRRSDLLQRSFVSSFHFRTVRRLVEIEPRVRAGITVPRGVLGITENGRGAPIARVGLGLLRRVTPLAAPLVLSASRATVLVLHHSLVGKAAVRRAHDRGAAVVTWTVDDPRDLVRVEEAGVDAVVTNDPRIFASTLET
jgi:glycerophosphoryl diester phosphodiesterase